MGRVDVETPESVRFSLELADIGSRALAFAVDSLIRFVVLIAGMTVLNYLSVDFTEVWAAAGIAAFALNWFYFVAFELTWNGQTPGKRLVGIRTVQSGGYPVQGLASMVRNLLRTVDSLPVAYGVGITSAFIDPWHRRLGDLVAGTYVIRDRARVPTVEAVTARPAPENAPWLARLSGIELDATTRELVHGYLERRDSMAPESLPRVRARIVESVLVGISSGQDRDRLSDLLPAGEDQDRLLEALIAREPGATEAL